MKIPPDFECWACRVRPSRHEDLCDVCEGDAQRGDRLQAFVDLERAPKFSDRWMAAFREVA